MKNNNSITVEGIEVEMVDKDRLPAFIKNHNNRTEFMWTNGNSKIFVYTQDGSLMSPSLEKQLLRQLALMIWVKGKKTENLRDIKKRIKL